MPHYASSPKDPVIPWSLLLWGTVAPASSTVSPLTNRANTHKDGQSVFGYIFKPCAFQLHQSVLAREPEDTALHLIPPSKTYWK